MKPSLGDLVSFVGASRSTFSRPRQSPITDLRCMSTTSSRTKIPRYLPKLLDVNCKAPSRHLVIPMLRKDLGRRGLHATSARWHGGINRPEPGTGIKVHFKDSKGNHLKTVEANEGDDILAIAHEYDIDLEGACEGSIACSTCHVILTPEHYDMLPEPSDDENDMLDMAFGLTDTSRLGCQVKLTRDLDGITCTLPAATRNMYVDGAKPSH